VRFMANQGNSMWIVGFLLIKTRPQQNTKRMDYEPNIVHQRDISRSLLHPKLLNNLWLGGREAEFTGVLRYLASLVH